MRHPKVAVKGSETKVKNFTTESRSHGENKNKWALFPRLRKMPRPSKAASEFFATINASARVILALPLQLSPLRALRFPISRFRFSAFIFFSGLRLLVISRVFHQVLHDH